MYMNTVVIGGHLTRDPEVRTFNRPDGTTFSVTDIGIATNRRYNNRSTGQRVEEVTFVDANCFGRFGEIIGEKFKKGMPILIQGRLRFRSWEDNGNTRSKLDVYVENFSFVPDGTRPEDGAPTSAGTADNLPADVSIPPEEAGMEQVPDDIPF